MSPIHFAIARSRFPAWLAMLLLFIAPVISQLLRVAYGHSSMMMDKPIMMDQHLPVMQHGQPMAHNPLKHHLSLMDDSACGYCMLLIHPPLDCVRLPQLWTLLQAAIAAAPLRLQPFVVSGISLRFHPRGPPVNAFAFA